MKKFLRENWLWIAIPLVVVLGVLVWLIAFGSDASSDFNYPLF